MRRLLGPLAILLLATTIVIAMYRDENAPFRRAAFISERSGYSEIYVSDISGENIQQITHFRNGEQNFPEWSGDGRLLSFIHAASPGVFEVYLTTVLGHHLKKVASNIIQGPVWTGDVLILLEIVDGQGVLKRVEHGLSTTIEPSHTGSFGVDRDWLVYISDRVMYLHYLPSGQTARLHENLPQVLEWDLYKDQVAYIANHQLFVIGGLAILPEPAPIENLHWSSDGEWLYFENYANNRRSIFRVRPDGNDLERLTDDRTCSFIQSFSADGRYLLYVNTRCRGFFMDVHVINLDNGEDTLHFTIDNTYQRMPRWTNDGRLTYEIIQPAGGDIDIMVYDIHSREAAVFVKNPSVEESLVISPNLRVKPWNSILMLVVGVFLLPAYDMIRMMVSRYSGWWRN